MANRNLWLIDMGDDTWAVCCLACRLALYRGPKPVADRVLASHRCEPVLPLTRPRRRHRSAYRKPTARPPGGGATPDPTHRRMRRPPPTSTSPEGVVREPQL